jgi:hypothetical protein
MIEEGKIMIFVSTGRCGTLRLSEILAEHLPEEFTVRHQMKLSRISNVIGNLSYYFGGGHRLKKTIYGKILQRKKTTHFINSDPLTAMVIPDDLIRSPLVAIIHIRRKDSEFAESFFRFSRKRAFSFIAHNFIPFWQLNIFPLQNLILGKRMPKQYAKTARIKNKWFKQQYGDNKFFRSVDMKELFKPGYIEILIKEFFETDIEIRPEALAKRSNISG